MKGWIKLTDCREPSHPVYVEAESVYLVQRDYEGPLEATIVNGMFYVRESMDEVMELLEEARGKKSLYEELKRAREECADRYELDEAECSNCSFKSSWQCMIQTDSLPCQLKLNLIPEEYR